MLKLTKKADYGLIAMKHLATASPGGTASAKEIADAYRIPVALLAKILQRLTKSGLLSSAAGTHGGYKLAREARRISVLEVVHALEGPVILASCFHNHSECDQSELCTVREPLRRVHDAMLRLLSTITISEMSRDGGPDLDLPMRGPAVLAEPRLQIL